MKKIAIIIAVLFSLLLISACGSNDKKEESEKDTNTADGSETITFESENGPVEVPADPQRVVVLSTFAGDVIKLGVPVVGADSWSMDNPNFQDALKDAEEVSDESLEKILELDPDLIIGLSNIKNYDKLSEIAPTVTFTYGKLDYIDQHIAVAKALNKEEEATAWAEDFQNRAAELGDKVREKLGRHYHLCN